MEGTRTRKRKETLFCPPRNVRKYLGHQSEPLPTVQFRTCFLIPQSWVPWAPKTVGKWPAQLIGRLRPHLPNHFPGTRKRMKIRERKEGKENVP